jgi:hypothetical protein
MLVLKCAPRGADADIRRLTPRSRRPQVSRSLSHREHETGPERTLTMPKRQRPNDRGALPPCTRER